MFQVLRKRGRAWAGGGTEEITVAYSTLRADNAKWSVSQGSFDVDKLEMGKWTSYDRNALWRFNSVDLPKNASLDSAKIVIKAVNDRAGATCNLKIFCADADSQGSVASAEAADDLVLTSACADWDNIAAWTSQAVYESPDITAPIEEVLARDGWASGNALMCVAKDNSSSNHAYRDAYTVGGDLTKAGSLVVTYQAPVALRVIQSRGNMGSTSNLVATLPLEPKEGNLLVAFVSYSAYSYARTCTPPDGWSSIDKLSFQNVIMETFYGIAGSGAPQAYTFAISNTADRASVIVYEIQNQGASPINQHSITSGTASSLATTAVTPSVNGCLLLTGCAVEGNQSLSSVSDGHAVMQFHAQAYKQLAAARKIGLTADITTPLSNTFTVSASTDLVAAAVLVAPK